MSLLTDLRRMTAAGKTQYAIGEQTFWADSDLEEALKKRVTAALLQAEVKLTPTMSPTRELTFLNGKVDFPGTLDTETAGVVTFTGEKIEGATIHDDGRIEFASNMAMKLPRLSGLAFDLNGAAADVLTDWASAVKLGYDISTDGQSMKRSQRYDQLIGQAKYFRAKSPIGTVDLSRSDFRVGGQGGPFTRAVLRSFERLGLPG